MYPLGVEDTNSERLIGHRCSDLGVTDTEQRHVVTEDPDALDAHPRDADAHRSDPLAGLSLSQRISDGFARSAVNRQLQRVGACLEVLDPLGKCGDVFRGNAFAPTDPDLVGRT